MGTLMTGTVKRVVQLSEKHRPHSFIIQDDEGNEYYSHLGDIKENEYMLYQGDEIECLNEGDKVKFEISEPEPRKKAIHVIRIE